MAMEALKQYAAQEMAKIEEVAEKIIKNDAQNGAIRDFKGNCHIETPVKNEQVIKVIDDKITRIYKKQSQAIRKSESLRSEINKMVLSGAEINDILIKSIECISLMTGDVTFYKQNLEKLKQA